MKTAEVQAIFKELRTEQVALIKAVAAQPAGRSSSSCKITPSKAQWDFGVEVITHFGYDWNRGRQDKLRPSLLHRFRHRRRAHHHPR